MTTVLLTGFEAFGRTPINPAESVARALDRERIGECEVVSRIVPNTFFHFLHRLTAANLPTRAGWIHLPHLPVVAALPENLGAPSMSVETTKHGVVAAIAAALRCSRDIDEPIPSRLQI